MSRKILRKIFSAALAALAAAPAHAAPAETFDPRKAYGVIAGVLAWKDVSFSTYSAVNRKDLEFYEALLSRGASPENFIVLLDSEATKAAVYAAVEKMSAKAPPDSAFIFYYAGHGVKRDRKGVFFASYDISRERADSTGVSPEKLGEIISGKFRGSKVLFFADCCYSGVLAETARVLNSGKRAALAITSASSANTSAGTWTFSQTVIDALRGRPLLDRDNDGAITFGELARDASDAMRYRERQASGAFLPGAFENAVVSPARGAFGVRVSSGALTTGEYVSVASGGEVRTARILGFTGGAVEVEFYDYSEKTVSTVPVSSVSQFVFKEYPAGAKVAVVWEGRGYPAQVLEARDGLHLVSYTGWPASWDEWVMGDQLSDLSSAAGTAAVSVEWDGSCYLAAVVKKEAGRAFIHYKGYGDSWDEWVTSERLDCRKR